MVTIIVHAEHGECRKDKGQTEERGRKRGGEVVMGMRDHKLRFLLSSDLKMGSKGESLIGWGEFKS